MGRQPARKNTTGAGVAWWSLRRRCKCTLWCWSMIFSSLWVSTREASPERRTGTANTFSTLREAAGFALCPLAKPACRTANIAFLWADSLAEILGPLPTGLRTTPTCVASLEGEMICPLTMMVVLASSTLDWSSVFLVLNTIN